MMPLALFLTHSPPRPSVSGDRIRTFHLMRELRRYGWRTSLFSLVPSDEPEGFEATLSEAADSWVLAPRGVGRAERIGRLLAAVIRRRPFQIGWFWSPRAAATCRAWLDESPDAVIFIEQLFMYPYVPAARRSNAVLDTQNLEAARMETMASVDASAARRAVARLQVGPVRRFEAHAVAQVARVIAVSEDELTAFDRLAPGRARLVPNGVDVQSFEPMRRPPMSRSLLYVGSMNYGPNIDAVSHFAKDIAPLVRSEGVSLDVVGSRPTARVYRAASRSPVPATVSGFVPDVASYYRRSRVMVVPLRHGGGTRLKILEALANGLPVVTTVAGCAGLGLTRREAIISDSPEEFARGIDRLITDDSLWLERSRAGREFVEANFDWAAIGRTFNGVMRDVVSEAELRGQSRAGSDANARAVAREAQDLR